MLLKTSILETQKSLKRLLEERSTGSPASTRTPPSPTGRVDDSSAPWFPEAAPVLTFAKPCGHFIVDNNQDIKSERYFGPTSFESLILDLKDVVTESFETATPTLRECAALAQHNIDLLLDQEDEPTKDGALPTTPAFVILELMIEPYFATFNDYFPIWTKERFRGMASVLRQSTVPERDLASVICCNNLILMTLTANSMRFRQGRPAKAEHRLQTPSMDSELITDLVNSAERAFKNIDQLLSPRLINVQALLSLVGI